MKIKTTIKPNVTTYKGRWCAELEDGRYVLNDGSMALVICEKVPEGMRVLECGIMVGIMMRTEEDFIWNVEHIHR